MVWFLPLGLFQNNFGFTENSGIVKLRKINFG
jgi:hypothetical protein